MGNVCDNCASDANEDQVNWDFDYENNNELPIEGDVCDLDDGMNTEQVDNEEKTLDLTNESSAILTIETNASIDITVTKTVVTENDQASFTASNIKGFKTIDITTTDDNAVQFPVEIEIYYTDEELAALGMNEDQLIGIFYYNETSSLWELLNDTGVSTTNLTVSEKNYSGYLWANLYHFSQYAPGSDVTAPNTYDVVVTPSTTNQTSDVILTANITDDTSLNWSNIEAAEYFINTTPGANGTGIAMQAEDGSFDSASENVTATIDTSVLNKTTHTIHVHGKDENGNWGTFATTLLTVDNIDPVLDQIENKTAVQDSKISFQITATDDDNEQANLTYSTTGPGEINSTTGLYEWTPDHNYYGDTPVTFKVSDTDSGEDEQTINIYVYSTLNISSVNVNSENIEDKGIIQDVKPGSTITTDIEVSNILSTPNIDDVKITLTSTSFGIDTTEELGIISGQSSKTKTIEFSIPYGTAEGTYEVTIETDGVDHGNNDPRYSNFTYYINVTKEEDEVVISDIELGDDTIKCLGQTNISINISNIGIYPQPFINLTIEQADLGLLKYNDTEDLVVGETNNYFFTIDTIGTPAGDYEITVTAVYYDEMYTQEEATLTIENCEPTRDPVDISDITIDEDSYDDTINLSDYFTDFNNDALTFNKEGAADITFNFLSNGLVNITPNKDFNGTNYVNFTASDGANTTKSNQVKITVTQVNDAPSIEAIEDTTTPQGTEFTYQVIAYDVEDDPLTYALEADAPEADINESGYIHGWTPTNNEANEVYEFNVSVSDGDKTTVEKFLVTVTDKNDAPVFDVNEQIIGISWDEDTTNSSLNISRSFYDVDGDSLTYEANTTSLSNIEVVSIENGIVTLKPADSFNGTETTRFRAKDSNDAYSNWSNEVTLTVTPVNDAPEIINFNPPTTAVVGEEYSYGITTTDIDEGAVISYSDNSTISAFDIDAEGTILFTPLTADVGSHSINITASDGELSDSEVFTLNIYDVLSLDNVQTSINDETYTELKPGDTLPEVSQGSSLKIKVDVKNWLSAFDVDSLKVTATIKDGTEELVTGEYALQTLGKGQKVEATIDLGTIDALIPNDKYNLIINASAQYDPSDRKTASAAWDAFVDIRSQIHQILITSATIADETVTCNRDTTATVNVKNIDAFEGDQSTTVTITQTELGISEDETQTITYNTEKTFSIPITISRDKTADNYTLSIHAETAEGSVADAEVNLEVKACETTYDPSEERPIVSAKEATTFSFTLPAELTLVSAVWKENGQLQADNDNNYIFEAKNENSGYHISVEIEDNKGEKQTHNWYPTTTTYPRAGPYTTEPALSGLNETQLESVNLTIINENSRIEFLESIDLSDIITLKDNIYIQGAIAAVNPSGEFITFLNKPAQITLTGLTYDGEPNIYYSASTFTTNPSEITALCPSSVCKLVSVTPSTADGNGVVVFNVTGFSSYMVATEIVPPPTNAPVASAGSDRTVTVDTEVTLDGSATGDTPLTYSWSEPSGITLSSTTIVNPTFTPTETGTYTFQLTVTNAYGEDTGSVTITVQEAAPIVDITSNLSISDLDIKVEGKKHNDITNGEIISRKAEPGDKIKFNIEVINKFKTEMEIDSIEVVITIKDIDDGDDLEEEADIKDLDEGDDDDVTIEFTIPTLVEEGTYDVIIEIDGEDEDGNDHEVRWELTLEVEKDKHALIIDKAKLSPQTIRCSRDTSLEVKVVNIGREDEDEVSIEIKNDDIGLDIEETEIELEEGDDQDAVFKKTYRLQIDGELRAGVYPITIKTYYDSHLADDETLDLIVEKCVEIVTPLEGEDVEVITDIPEIKKQLPETRISFKATSEYITLLAILFVILAGGVIFLIGAVVILSKKK